MGAGPRGRSPGCWSWLAAAREPQAACQALAWTQVSPKLTWARACPSTPDVLCRACTCSCPCTPELRSGVGVSGQVQRRRVPGEVQG